MVPDGSLSTLLFSFSTPTSMIVAAVVLVATFSQWDRFLEFCCNGITVDGQGFKSCQKPSFPFGNMTGMSEDPTSFFEAVVAQSRKTGGFATCWVVHKPSLLVLDPKWIKHVLSPKITLKKTDRLVNKTLPVLDLFLGEGIFTAQSEVWKKQHRIAMRGVGSKHTKSYFPAIQRNATEFVQNLERLSDESKEKSVQVEVRPLFRAFALKTILKIAFGEGILTAEEEKEILEVFPQILESIGMVRYLLNAYLYSPLPEPTKLRRRITRAHDLALKVLTRYADQISKNSRGQHTNEGSVLKALHEAKDTFQLSDTEAAHMLYTFMIGGMDTTSIALSHLAYLVARHPRVQAKVSMEVKKAAQRINNAPADKDKWSMLSSELPYLSAVIKETLRLYPSFPYLVERNTVQSVKIGPVTVPKGRAIVVCPWITARMEEHWGSDAKEFRPERFLKKDGDVVSITDDCASSFLTFGSGVRHCVGKNIAAMEMKTVLFELFQKYKFEMPAATSTRGPLYKDQYWQLTVNAMAPKSGMYLNLIRSQSL